MADYDVIFVLGGPGAGKGTVCHHLTVNYPGEWVHLSAGDLLRAERAKPGSALADQINKIINEGGIVPADVTVGLLSAAMAAASSKKFLIDGFPRNAENMSVWFDKMNDTCTVKLVLNLDLAEDVTVTRLLERGKTSGRSDDNADTIKKRLSTFYADTVPVLKAFYLAGKLRTVSSLPPPPVVLRQASKFIDSLSTLEPYQRTFALIKPDAVAKGSVQQVLAAIADANLVVVAMKVVTMTDMAVESFYREHYGKPFFPSLKRLMTSGPAVALILESKDAIARWRAAMGPTSTEKARAEAPDSIRARFGTDNTKNAVHGSDSEKSALREIQFWMDPSGHGSRCESGVISSTGVIRLNIRTGPEDHGGSNISEPLPAIAALDAGATVPAKELRPLLPLEDTFAMIKPVTADSHAEEILGVVAGHGFEVVQQLRTSLTLAQAEQFYAEHRGKAFFADLTTYMSSGPVVALHLRRAVAIAGWRHLIGPTNLEKAKATRPDSLRARFGIDGTRNACHGSDSSASAYREICFFFSAGGIAPPIVSRAPVIPYPKPASLSPVKSPVKSPTKAAKPIMQSATSDQVPTMSRDDISLMQTYASYQLDPVMKALLQRLMLARPANVLDAAINELQGFKADPDSMKMQMSESATMASLYEGDSVITEPN
jgi:nucleoside diphosphate kinase/adenylate kinase family enzyme